MTNAELKEILEKHKKWLYNEEDGERANLSGANLSDADLSDADLSGANLSDADLRCANLRCADLRCANLSGANLSDADLSDANLSDANLSDADLRCADLSGANLSDADLRCANLRCADLRCANLSGANLSDADLSDADLSDADLSGAENLLSSIDYLKDHFEFTKDGMIAYKCFNGSYKPPEKWVIQQGSVIAENVNMCRENACGCGINVAPLEWVRKEYPNKEIWKILIRYEWLSGVCVPYNTDGKIRCERAELVEVVT